MKQSMVKMRVTEVATMTHMMTMSNCCGSMPVYEYLRYSFTKKTVRKLTEEEKDKYHEGNTVLLQRWF